MRAFISFELSNQVKKASAEIQNKLQKQGLHAKWVKPENIHLTVAFLGSIDNKQREQVKEILTPINRFIEKPINLQLRNLSAFPNVSRARIVFVNLSGEIETLSALSVKIRSKLIDNKIWFDEKPFVAHLTLGRFKKPQNLTQIVQKIKIKQLTFVVGQVSLNQSLLTSSGPIYTKL